MALYGFGNFHAYEPEHDEILLLAPARLALTSNLA